MRSSFELSSLCFLVVGACGGSTATDDGSGLARDKPLSSLSQQEARELCEFIADTFGGEGTKFECSGVTLTLNSTSECAEEVSVCDALVSEAEACARAMARAFARCDLDVRPPSCEPLLACSMTSSRPSCIEGEARTCTCDDGRPGAQLCADGEFGPCECGPTRETCIPGQSFQCLCVDGSMGAQTCVGSGASVSLSPCQCVSGSCDPSFCPSADIGTPCCVTTNGPCGTDTGTGCIAGL